MAPTAQAQTAIDALRAAGFKRSEFKVKTERIWRKDSEGRRFYEYGDATITILAKKDRQIELVPAMLKSGLTICQPYYNDKTGERQIAWPIVTSRYTKSGVGQYIIWDSTEDTPQKRYQYIGRDDPRHPLCRETE